MWHAGMKNAESLVLQVWHVAGLAVRGFVGFISLMYDHGSRCVSCRLLHGKWYELAADVLTCCPMNLVGNNALLA